MKKILLSLLITITISPVLLSQENNFATPEVFGFGHMFYKIDSIPNQIKSGPISSLIIFDAEDNFIIYLDGQIALNGKVTGVRKHSDIGEEYSVFDGEKLILIVIPPERNAIFVLSRIDVYIFTFTSQKDKILQYFQENYSSFLN